MNQASEELKEQPKKKLSALEKMDEILLRCDEIEREVGRSDLVFLPEYTTYDVYEEVSAESKESFETEFFNPYFEKNRIKLGSCNSSPTAQICSYDFKISSNEYHHILSLCTKSGWISILESNTFITKFHLSPEGYKRIAELRKSIDSTQAFVAMWFDESMNEAFATIKSVVESGEFDYKAYRVDKDPHNENIVAQIIGQIKRSKFLIAELTGNRGGVYWEAGFAKGLGKPVIHCIKEDWFYTEDEQKKIHFNLRQFNLIIWKDPEDLRTKLIDRIRAIKY